MSPSQTADKISIYILISFCKRRLTDPRDCLESPVVITEIILSCWRFRLYNPGLSIQCLVWWMLEFTSYQEKRLESLETKPGGLWGPNPLLLPPYYNSKCYFLKRFCQHEIYDFFNRRTMPPVRFPITRKLTFPSCKRHFCLNSSRAKTSEEFRATIFFFFTSLAEMSGIE